MNEYLEKARELRARTDVHYNCCQSVLVPFAADLGLTEEQACALGSNFRAGMLHGATCGAVSGAFMVLGGLGLPSSEASALLQKFTREHGSSSCAELLRASRERGEERKAHCDGLVYEMVEAVAEIKAAAGL